MNNFDFSPLFRSTIGFDRLTRVLDSAMQVGDQATGYPPYNIEKVTDDAYRITIAVAGFAEDDLEVVARENTLVVRGRADKAERRYLHHGIAGRAFERKFQLADHIRVVGAGLENGILSIDLEREIPEALKPRTIEIRSAGAQKIERKAA